MSFTGRIKLFLVAVALLPPLLMMTVVYIYSERERDLEFHQTASRSLTALMQYRTRFESNLIGSVRAASESSWFRRATQLAHSGRIRDIDFGDLDGYNLDFVEIIDSTGRVLASSHRPGLVGESKEPASLRTLESGTKLAASVEYDTAGAHAALTVVSPPQRHLSLYAGRYLETRFQPTADLVAGGLTHIYISEPGEDKPGRFSRMDSGVLFADGDLLHAVLLGNEQAGFYVVAEFDPPQRASVFGQFFDVISIVALGSVLVALLLGIYISNRAKREIDNLVEAFEKVAQGDMNTTVMAYREDEFAQLADSFSEMMQKLRDAQHRLATTEKIAAWQAMARKLAHEIKNPLTPIGISAEDLRRSYQAQLPGFDETLDRNTRMIRSEVNRLSRLLGEFVDFARMKPPEIREVEFAAWQSDLESLYGDPIRAGRLSLNNESSRSTLRGDPDQLKQLLVNLIKNGLEVGEDTHVKVDFRDIKGNLRIVVRDDGPGWPEEILSRQFEPYLSTKKHGSGLGLVICQRIVHDHGGAIAIGNRDEGGAEVVVDLPQD